MSAAREFDGMKIPSDKEFAYAKQRMKELSEREANFKVAIISTLSGNIPCHDVWVWLSEKSCTVSYIFPTNADLEQHQSKELNEKIESAIKEATLNLGINKVSIDYHSHEYVLKKHNGNYEQYFR